MMRRRARQLLPAALAVTLALFVAAAASPQPAHADCGPFSFICDPVGELADFVLGPVDEMLDGKGVIQAGLEDSTEWDVRSGPIAIDGNHVRAALFDVTRIGLDCISNFDPSGSISASLAAADVMAELQEDENASDEALGYAVPEAGDQVSSFVEEHPEVLEDVSGNVAESLGPRIGRSVPIVNRGLALLTIRDAFESCGDLIDYATADDDDASPRPVTPTTVPPIPTPGTTTTTTTTVPSYDPDRIPRVPGGSGNACNSPNPPTPCRNAGR